MEEMIYKNLVTNFVRQWNYTRDETLELLDCLTDDQLQWKPEGEKWQPFYFQFGCIGRTQIVYTKAIETGSMDFTYFRSPDLPKKDTFQTKDTLREFLKKTDTDWTNAIRTKRRDEEYSVSWPGFTQPLTVHITSLSNHERLHHGQLVSYFTLANIDLPQNFKQNWAL